MGDFALVDGLTEAVAFGNEPLVLVDNLGDDARSRRVEIVIGAGLGQVMQVELDNAALWIGYHGDRGTDERRLGGRGLVCGLT